MLSRVQSFTHRMTQTIRRAICIDANGQACGQFKCDTCTQPLDGDQNPLPCRKTHLRPPTFTEWELYATHAELGSQAARDKLHIQTFLENETSKDV